MMIYPPRAPDTDLHGRCPYVQMLQPHEVIRLAISICERLGFAGCDEDRIREHMKDCIPVILEHNGHRLWIDRYYIALEDDSPAGFRYLYLTRWHAEETLRDHRGLLQAKREPVLDSKALKQYRKVLDQMRGARRAYMMYPMPA